MTTLNGLRMFFFLSSLLLGHRQTEVRSHQVQQNIELWLCVQ